MTENDVRLLTELEQRCKSNSHRLDKLEEKTEDIHTIATSIQLISQDMNYMKKGQEALSEKVDGLSNKMDTQIHDLSSKVVAIENKPALETASTVSKVRVAIYVAIGSFLGTGIVGAILSMMK